MTGRRAGAALLATLLGGATVCADELRPARIGWVIVWHAAAEDRAVFRQRVEASVARGLTEAAIPARHWIPVSREQLPDEILFAKTVADLREFPARWTSRFDQVVVTFVRRQGTSWQIEAGPVAPWIETAPWQRSRAAYSVRMLPLLIAEVIRDAWAPSLTVIAVKQDRLVVAAPHLAPAPASRSSGFAWPTRTLFRVLVARGGTEKQRFRRLPYAFVPGLGAPASMGGTWTVPLVAAASDRRTIDSALKNGELVMLAPGIPRPGRIRVRAIDRESGAPVPNVEVFASRQGFSIAPESLIDVTPATGEPVEFLDRQGELWYVSLKSSARVYELPLLCSDSGAVVDVPVTGVDESLLADELAFLSDDFNGAMRRFQRALRQGDRLATEGRHADAYAAYREARAMCPDADEMRRLAEETYRRYHPGREQHAADRERVETFHERVRQQLEPRRRELDMRLNRLREAQELNERVTQAEGLEKQARDSLSRYEAEEALRLYAAAIALLPEGVKYRRDLVQERLRLADTWRVRGGDRQRRARRYVYEELAALTPQNVASGMPVLGEHIRCLIDYRDRYALFKAVDAVRRLFDRVVAEAATPEALSDATRMEELSSVANSLNTLLDRIHDVLREDS